MAICDLDGTLIDSDKALADAFVALGVPRSEITFGHVLAEECARLGLNLADYLSAYDENGALPFPGVDTVVNKLNEWAVCSNKHPVSGRAELQRLGWNPNVAMFSDTFNGPKSPQPVLRAMKLSASEALFVGDTAHDRACALQAGMLFALAGWNPRAIAEPGDIVLQTPDDLLDVLNHSD